MKQFDNLFYNIIMMKKLLSIALDLECSQMVMCKMINSCIRVWASSYTDHHWYEYFLMMHFQCLLEIKLKDNVHDGHTLTHLSDWYPVPVVVLLTADDHIAPAENHSNGEIVLTVAEPVLAGCIMRDALDFFAHTELAEAITWCLNARVGVICTEDRL